jgi:hypothetical protein
MRQGDWVCALGLAGLLTTGAAFAAPGEEWSYTGDMEMMGMKVPIPASKVCEDPKQPRTPPMEGNCTFSNVQAKGNTTSFDFACAAPDKSSGSGKVTLAGNKTNARYTMDAEGTRGVVTLTGTKVGACDTSAKRTPSIPGMPAPTKSR